MSRIHRHLDDYAEVWLLIPALVMLHHRSFCHSRESGNPAVAADSLPFRLLASYLAWFVQGSINAHQSKTDNRMIQQLVNDRSIN